MESKLPIVIVGAFIACWLILYTVPVGLWFQATVSGVRVTLLELIFMRWRKVPPALIVRNMISSAKAGIMVNREDLEAHFLAGGDVDKVVNGLIYAKAKGYNLTFKDASRMDLAREDIIKNISK